MKYEVKHAMNHGDRCPFCGQELHVENGVFQCGGDGEGICSIWSAIYDFGRAVKSLPKYATLDLDLWIDEWILGEIGQTWTEADWDRELHLRGVREIWNLPPGCQKVGPVGVV